MAVDLSDDLLPRNSLSQSSVKTAATLKNFKKNSGLPWKPLVWPILLWIFCFFELILLFWVSDSPKIAIPAPILEFQMSPMVLPAPFCPSSAKIVEKECAQPFEMTNVAPANLPGLSMRIERLASQPDNPHALAADFFKKGVRHSMGKEWRAAAEAFFNAQHFFPQSPEYAFNLALSLEHLGKKNQAIVYYEKALQNAKNAQKQLAFDPQQLAQHLDFLKKTIN